MKHRKQLYFILFIILTFSLQTCRKDDSFIPDPLHFTPKMKKLMIFNAIEDTVPWAWDFYEYDDKWRLIKKTGYSGPPNNPWVTGYDTYEYDFWNRLTKKSNFCGQYITLCGYVLYLYYSGNNISITASYDENNVFQGSSNFEYDSRGNKIKSWWQDANGNVYSVVFFEYDERNNRIKETWQTGFILYGYDNLNRLVSLRAFSLPDSVPAQNYTYEYEGYLLIRHNYWNNITGERWFMTEYFYDGNGNLIEVVDEKDGVRNVYRQIKYDEENLKIEVITYDRFFGYVINSIVRYEYYKP